MNIHYRNNRTSRLCTDLIYARKKLNRYSEDLLSLINFIENATDLNDVAVMQKYHLHPLKGKNKGKFSLDIAGRSIGWRLVIIPLDEQGNCWDTSDVNIIYKSTTAIIAWEVTNHYE